MRQEFFNLELDTNGQSLYEFTNQTNRWVKDNEFNNGIINISIQHTSASLIIKVISLLDRFFVIFLKNLLSLKFVVSFSG